LKGKPKKEATQERGDTRKRPHIGYAPNLFISHFTSYISTSFIYIFLFVEHKMNGWGVTLSNDAVHHSRTTASLKIFGAGQT
jgi:hypothetical protein